MASFRKNRPSLSNKTRSSVKVLDLFRQSLPICSVPKMPFRTPHLSPALRRSSRNRSSSALSPPMSESPPPSGTPCNGAQKPGFLVEDCDFPHDREPQKQQRVHSGGRKTWFLFTLTSSVKVTTKGGRSQAVLTREAISGKLWSESKGQEDKSCPILCHY